MAVLYDEEFYDNPNIVFEIKDTGFKIGDLINGKETKEIYITFKYKNGVLPENKTLNSNINFKIANPNRLVLAENIDSTGNYLGSAIAKNKIETVKFELGTLVPDGTIASFDASEKQDKSIIGYYTDIDDNSLHELIFLSAEPIAPNVNGEYLFQYLENVKEINFNNFTTFGVESMKSMFYNCSKLTELNANKFDTNKVTDMRYMFYGCSELSNIDVSGFDTSKVTSMKSMFNKCSKLTELNVNGFDTSQVTDMNNMFYFCKGLTSLDVSGFDTSKVIDMSNMFYNCNVLTSLELSKFNTKQATNMSNMFGYCSRLKTIYVTPYDQATGKGWTTSAVTNSSGMFTSCSKLVGQYGTIYNSSYIDKTYARIDKIEMPGYFTNIKNKSNRMKKSNEHRFNR